MKLENRYNWKEWILLCPYSYCFMKGLQVCSISFWGKGSKEEGYWCKSQFMFDLMQVCNFSNYMLEYVITVWNTIKISSIFISPVPLLLPVPFRHVSISVSGFRIFHTPFCIRFRLELLWVSSISSRFYAPPARGARSAGSQYGWTQEREFL